jgi:hypothetical protein
VIRDVQLNAREWDKWIKFSTDDIADRISAIEKPSGDPSYRPQYIFNLSREYRHLMLLRYSRGDAIHALEEYFGPLIESWEEAERLGKAIWTDQQQYTRHAWKVNLDHYINCFWLVGLALTLNIPDDSWNRLIALIGNEGEDALLDRVIASRQPMRPMGTKLCHPKPYQRLLDAVLAAPDQQAKQLRSFVDHWYAELDRPATKTMPAMYARPYWYKYHELEGGYFGYWCIEAVAAVKAFGLDDSLCVGQPNYPGDLLRPDGPTTHGVIESFPAMEETPLPTHSKRGLFSRLFRRP